MSENTVILCGGTRRTYPRETMLKQMPPCPICGCKAFLSHDVADGADFGFSGGCSSFCLDDGIHGISSIWDTNAPRVTGHSFREVFDKWIAYCKRMDEA